MAKGPEPRTCANFVFDAKVALLDLSMEERSKRLIYTTTIRELGSLSHNRDGVLEPNSIMVVCMDPPGFT